MAVVKSVRRISRAAGKVLDQEDRDLLARLAILVGSGAGLTLTIAGTLGLAWRVFNLAAG